MTARFLFLVAALSGGLGLIAPAEAHHSPLEDTRPLPKPVLTDPD
jgi:hypothetical protein